MLGTILLSLALVSATGDSAADWPTYLHDNGRTGYTPASVQLPLAVRWVRGTPRAPRRAWTDSQGRTIEGHVLRDRITFDDALHVVGAGDRLYYGSSVDHKVYCLDLATGAERWSFFTGGPVRLAPTIAGDRLLVGSDDGYAYCLDRHTGRLAWKLRLGPDEEFMLARGEMISRWPVRTSVLVDGDIAYLGAGIFPHENVYLCAVRVDDGTIVWRNDTISHEDAGRNDLTPQGYLLSSGEMVFVPSGRSLPAAVDRQTGRIIHKRIHGWRGAAGGVVGGSQALLADDQIFSGGAHHFLAMDQKTGDVDLGYFAGRQMVVDGPMAYLANGKELVRLDRQVHGKASLERSRLELELQGRARQLGKALDTDERVIELRKRIGELANAGVAWRVPCSSESALIAAGDRVIAGGPDRLVAFDARTGQEVWQAALAGDARGLAVVSGQLVVSTTDGKVYGFGPAAPSGQPAPALAATEPTPAASPYPRDEWTDRYAAAADRILAETEVRSGFCLVVGSETGRLAYELARRSELAIYGIEPNEAKVAAARQSLQAAGLYGHRIVIHQADFADIPYSNYFANLVVSDTVLRTGRLPADPAVIARHVKPCGGVVHLGGPGVATPVTVLVDWLLGTRLADQSTLDVRQSTAILRRGPLPGAGNWSHQYGDPGNTACSDDQLVRGGLGVLWYGDPGPSEMVNRHDGAVGPISTNGRLFVQGQSRISAYDAYNGQFLWEYHNPETIRTGVFQNQNPGNLAASDTRLFVMTQEVCLELDAATGKLAATHRLPKAADDGQHEWGYVAQAEGLLFGTATRRKVLDEKMVRRGRRTEDATDAIFAIDLASGNHLWSYKGRTVSHHTIALGPGQVYFIDSSITSEERAAILSQNKDRLKKLEGEEAKRAEERAKAADIRLAVALDARSGDKLWETPVDVTDCSDIGTGGGKLTMIYKDHVLLLGGANANGHYWKQFLEGEFSRRRLVALSASGGYELWAKDANYRHRPIIVGDRVIAEPWGFDLATGEQIMRRHPLTGQEVPWSFFRPGHHCGMNTATGHMLFFRSGYTGFYDLDTDSGTGHFAGHRLGCWINAIPANGLLMIPEASAGCVCLFSIASTVVMEPRAPRRPWMLYSSVGPTTPVDRLALNLGAPGDRRDERGMLWLAYPRPSGRLDTGLHLPLALETSFLPGGAFFSRDGDQSEANAGQGSWIRSSGGRGLSRVRIPLRGKTDGPGRYLVALHFTAPPGDQPGQRVFDVLIQGDKVLSGVDVAGQAKDPSLGLIRQAAGIDVEDLLQIEFVPRAEKPAPEQMPILSGIEITKEPE